MKLAIDIVQSLLLPKLEKDASFDINQTNIAFWETFTTAFLDFEKDAKPVYAAIYSLELKDAEKIISKLDTVYISFIKELAENHVLGISSEAIDYLIISKNSTFEKEVHFFTDLKNVITKVERKRIKTELPNAFDKLSFEISDDAIALAITKKEREALKEKMNAWDEQLVTSEEAPVYSVSAKKEPKVISLSWIKYAAAACIVLTAGIATFTNQTGDNNVVTTESSQIETYPLVAVSSFSESSTVIEETSSAFASKPKVISIVRNNQVLRIASIVKAIENYQIQLQKILPNHKVEDNSTIKKLKDTIVTLKNELELLKIREQQYVFNGKLLTLFVSSTSKEDYVLLFNEIYYLKNINGFYKLSLSKEPQNYKKETDTAVLNDLKEILFRKYGI
ncbi:hypothetical protein MCEGE10_00603 [Flavobacteriaceae bacterium]